MWFGRIFFLLWQYLRWQFLLGFGLWVFFSGTFSPNFQMLLVHNTKQAVFSFIPNFGHFPVPLSTQTPFQMIKPKKIHDSTKNFKIRSMGPQWIKKWKFKLSLSLKIKKIVHRMFQYFWQQGNHSFFAQLYPLITGRPMDLLQSWVFCCGQASKGHQVIVSELIGTNI